MLQRGINLKKMKKIISQTQKKLNLGILKKLKYLKEPLGKV